MGRKGQGKESEKRTKDMTSDKMRRTRKEDQARNQTNKKEKINIKGKKSTNDMKEENVKE